MEDVLCRITSYPANAKPPDGDLFSDLMATWGMLSNEVSKMFDRGAVNDGLLSWQLNLRCIAPDKAMIEASVVLIRESDLKNATLVRHNAIIAQMQCCDIRIFPNGRLRLKGVTYINCADDAAAAVIAQLYSTRS